MRFRWTAARRCRDGMEMESDTLPPRLPAKSSGKGRPAGRKGPPWPKSRAAVPRRGARASEMPDDRVVLYGWHPVSEALRNPRRRALRLLATENGLHRLQEALGTLPLPPEIVGANE